MKTIQRCGEHQGKGSHHLYQPDHGSHHLYHQSQVLRLGCVACAFELGKEWKGNGKISLHFLSCSSFLSVFYQWDVQLNGMDRVQKTNLYFVKVYDSIMQPASFRNFQCFAWVLKNAHHLQQIMYKLI